MLRWSRTATFLEILALLVENHTPLDEAVTLAGEASGDRQTLRAARQLAAMLRTVSGCGPCDAPPCDRGVAAHPFRR